MYIQDFGSPGSRLSDLETVTLAFPSAILLDIGVHTSKRRMGDSKTSLCSRCGPGISNDWSVLGGK